MSRNTASVRARRGITVLGLLLLIIGIAILAVLLTRYVRA
jgi:hypothetical protein